MMTTRKRFAAVLAAVMMIGFSVRAQEEPPDMEQYMKEYMEKYATPAEHHEHLAQLAGVWTTTATFRAAPGAPPQESKGRAEHRMILGGRFLLTSYQGEFMGMPFEGMGIAAYDRYLEKYVETWVDSMGTMVMVSEGTCSLAGAVRTLVAEFDDPMTRQPQHVRSVYRVVDADHYILEMYNRLPNGEEFKMLEIAHTRAQ